MSGRLNTRPPNLVSTGVNCIAMQDSNINGLEESTFGGENAQNSGFFAKMAFNSPAFAIRILTTRRRYENRLDAMKRA